MVFLIAEWWSPSIFVFFILFYLIYLLFSNPRDALSVGICKGVQTSPIIDLAIYLYTYTQIPIIHSATFSSATTTTPFTLAKRVFILLIPRSPLYSPYSYTPPHTLTSSTASNATPSPWYITCSISTKVQRRHFKHTGTMYPCLAFSHNQSSIRSTPSEASPTLINHVSTITDSFMGDGYFNSFDSEVPRAPPPSLDNDTLLDIHPRKTSFSDVLGMSSACAFPSWPKRPSLLSSDSEGSTASAYLSDEDLLFSSGPVSSSESIIEEESAAQEPAIGAHSLTTEQQIQMLRAAAEEEAHRARFLAQVQAHARAQQALRVAQMAATEKENTKSKKRRTFSDRKKRATFVRAISSRS